MKARHACAALALLALAGYGRWLWEPGAVATAHSDLVAFHLGIKQVLFDSLRAGHGLPLWRADQLAGAPAFTDPQAQYLFPLHFLFWLLPPARALGPTLWLQLLALALSTWALGGALRLGPWPRLFMGAAALFSAKAILAAYAGWLAYLSTVALLPLLFAVVIEAVERPRLALAAQAAVVGGLCLLSGMAQLLYYALFFLAAFTAAARPARRSLLLLAAGALLSLGLAAFWLLPFLAEAKLYARGKLDYPLFLSGHGSARQLLTLVWPDALGTPLRDPAIELWEDSAHFGFAALLLALVGAARAGRRPWAAALTASFAAALLLSFDSPLLRALFAHLPGMDLFRIPSRLLFLAAMFGTCLAGLGLEALLLRCSRRGALALGLAAVAAASLEGALQARRFFAHPLPEALEPHPSWTARLEPGLYRTAPIVRSTVVPGWAQGLGLQLVTGYNALSLSHYQRYFGLLATGAPQAASYRGNWTELTRLARPDLLDALSVRYLIAPGSVRVPFARSGTDAAQPVFVFYSGMQRRDLSLSRNPGEQPRARFVDDVLAARDDDDAAARLLAHDARTVAVARLDADLHDPAVAPGESVAIEAAAAGALTLSTRALRDRFVLVSEIWHPGWTATIDGVPAPLVRADVALLGLRVPAGAHRVALRFTPLHFALGCGISAAALLVVLALLLRSRRPA